MASMNHVFLIGRVARVPELRYTATGKAVASFVIAVDRRRFGSNSGASEADFIPIVAWERLAEICNEFLGKGHLIAIVGRLQTRTYETQDGQKRKAFEVVAREMQMLGRPASRTNAERNDVQPVGVSAPVGVADDMAVDDVFSGGDVSLDDVPF